MTRFTMWTARRRHTLIWLALVAVAEILAAVRGGLLG